MSDYFQKTSIMKEFFNVWCVLAIGLFAVNNHYLKNEYHNWLTGKLSDFAFCFFLPLYISALTLLLVDWPAKYRLVSGVVVTMFIFSSVKLSPDVSDILNDTLSIFSTHFGLGSSINLTDKTDLIALPMVAAAYIFGARKHEY